MSWPSSGVDQGAPELWACMHDQMVGRLPEPTERFVQSPFSPIDEEQDIQAINPSLFNYSVQHGPVLPPSEYTMPSSTFQNNTGPLEEIANGIFPGYCQDVDKTNHHENSRMTAKHLPTHSSAHPSGRGYNTSVPEIGSTSEDDLHPGSTQSWYGPPFVYLRPLQFWLHDSIRCEWKGCTYAGVFSRKAELKRHVETKHIAPREYKCPVFKCRKSFNRKDNQEEHLRRVHHRGLWASKRMSLWVYEFVVFFDVDVFFLFRCQAWRIR